MQCEVTVILKSEDSTFRKQFNCYDEIQLNEKCPTLRGLVDQAKKEFKLIPEEIQVKAQMEWLAG